MGKFRKKKKAYIDINWTFRTVNLLSVNILEKFYIRYVRVLATEDCRYINWDD